MSTTRTGYSVKLKDAMADLVPSFRDVGARLDQLTKKRAELAPAFLKTYQLWQRETRRPFLAFIHELDPSVPVNDRNGYRSHPSYRAALYLKGLAEHGEDTTRHGLTLLTMLARTVKSFLPATYKSQKDQEAAIRALVAATKWRDRDVRRFIAQVRRAKPIQLPNAPRLVDVKPALVAFERERVEHVA